MAPQAVCAPPGHVRIRISAPNDDSAYAAGEHEVDAWGRASVVVARLQGNVEGPTARAVSGGTQGHDLRVGTAGRFVPPGGDELAVVHDGGAHVWIWRRTTSPCELDGHDHPPR